MNVGMTKRRHPPSKYTLRCSVNSTATGCSQATVTPLAAISTCETLQQCPSFFWCNCKRKIETHPREYECGGHGGVTEDGHWRRERKVQKYSVLKIKLICSVGIKDVWMAPERRGLPLSSDPDDKKKKRQAPSAFGRQSTDGTKTDPNTINLTNEQIFIQVLQREHSCFSLTNKRR